MGHKVVLLDLDQSAVSPGLPRRLGNGGACRRAAIIEAEGLDVRAFATHALFSESARDTLNRSAVEKIAVTATVALDGLATPARTRVVRVADLLGHTILAVFQGTSVSTIFAGENELF